MTLDSKAVEAATDALYHAVVGPERVKGVGEQASRVVAAYLDEAGTQPDEERQFPIQSRSRFITSIPWSMAELAYRSYHRQHPGQSLEHLAERGGFGAEEVLRFLIDALSNGDAVLVREGSTDA